MSDNKSMTLEYTDACMPSTHSLGKQIFCLSKALWVSFKKKHAQGTSLTLLSVHGKHSHACPFLLALLLSLRLWDRALKAITVTAHLRYRQQQITLTSWQFPRASVICGKTGPHPFSIKLCNDLHLIKHNNIHALC